MKLSILLHVLRNPHGYEGDFLRKIHIEAADRIEQLEEAYINMRDFAEKNGLDTKTIDKNEVWFNVSNKIT